MRWPLLALGLSVVPFLNSARKTRLLFPFDEELEALEAASIPAHHDRSGRSHRVSATTSKTIESDSFSSCLLTMDDNHFLMEWLAYHYHALPLRRLIVAVDPNSKTSPSFIFDRWRKHGMIIQEWNDTDFMTDDEKVKAVRKGKHSPGTNVHRQRQRSFYAKCLTTLKKENRTWTTLTDTDEYLVLNSYTQRHAIDVERPGSIAKFLNADNNTETINSQQPPCLMLPRLTYGSMESKAEQVSKDIPAVFNGSDFVTQRFRKHGPLRMVHGLAKTIIDLSRVDANHISIHQSPHRPIFHYCPKNLLRIKVPQSSLVVRHYVGTWEQFSFRDDARIKDGMKTNKVRIHLHV